MHSSVPTRMETLQHGVIYSVSTNGWLDTINSGSPDRKLTSETFIGSVSEVLDLKRLAVTNFTGGRFWSLYELDLADCLDILFMNLVYLVLIPLSTA